MNDEKKINAIDQILDDNNCDNVILYDENQNPTEFEQIAIIPLKERLFAILKPVSKIFDLAEDEALVFEVCDDDETDEEYIKIVQDTKIIEAVFNEYYKLVDEANN